MTDNINPQHYTSGKVECIDALEAATSQLSGIEAVCTANAIKYLWRWKQKNGVEDLRKAKWYLERLISQQIQPTATQPYPYLAGVADHMKAQEAYRKIQEQA